MTLASSMALSSCNPVAETTSDPVHISVVIKKVDPTTALIYSNPDDYRAYYIIDYMSVEEYDTLGVSDQKMMEDYANRYYLDYQAWKKEQEKTGTPYIASFASMYLERGEVETYAVKLVEQTDYYCVAWCVNPETGKPIGDLQKVKFTTPAVDRSSLSPVVIDLRISMGEIDGYNYCSVAYRPSENGKPTKSPYTADIHTEEWLNENFDGDLVECIRETDKVLSNIYVNYWDYALSDVATATFVERYESIEDFDFEVGKTYIMYAVPLWANWEKRIYYHKFVFEPGTTISYTHSLYEN